MYKISELAANLGLSTHTLRYYEKCGLIAASERSESGYRLYSEADRRQLEFIKTAKESGFTLDEITNLLSIELDKGSHTCEEVAQLTREKLSEVNQRLRELKKVKTTLERLLKSCCGGPESATHCSILQALEEN